MTVQLEFDLRCEWGRQGVERLASVSDVVVIVDVFSFSTSVDIATSRGAMVYPFVWRDERAAEFARSHGALLAGENPRGWSLKPSTLEDVDPGVRIVLPSPNGSTLTTLAGAVPTITGCLRNARAVAAAAARLGTRISLIPSGEQWPDGTLRPCLEDVCGAGAILSHLTGRASPEVEAARAVFQAASSSLPDALRRCESGREKETQGLERDIELASALDASGAVPTLRDGAYAALV